MERPSGVRLLAVQHGISGILALVGALWVVGYSLVVSVLPAIFSIFALFVAYGLWNGMRWSWFWSIVLSAIGMIIGVMGLIGFFFTFVPYHSEIALIAMEVLIIFYLTRDHVRQFFARPSAGEHRLNLLCIVLGFCSIYIPAILLAIGHNLTAGVIAIVLGYSSFGIIFKWLLSG